MPQLWRWRPRGGRVRGHDGPGKMPGPHSPETRPSLCHSRAPACSSCANAQPPAGPAARSGFASEPVCLALFTLRMGVGGGAQSCACGGCRWVTHPHRSLLHQFWWGKAPLIGFVENDLPPVGREGRRLTASRAAPYPGGCLLRAKPAAAGCLPSPRSTRPPGHRAALPAAARESASRLNQWQRRHHAGSGGQAVPTATSTVPPLLFSRCSCFANRRGNDALRGRLRLQVIPRARAAAGWNRGQVEPFRLRTRLAGKRKPRPSTTIPLDPASPGGKKALSVLAKAKPVFHGSGSALWFCLGYSLPYWLPGLIGLGLGLNPIECRTQPYWVGD